MVKPLASIATRLLLFREKVRRSADELDMSEVRSALIVETSRMGDVVAMLPLLCSLHDANPHIRLIVAADERYRDVLACVSHLAAVIGLGDTKSWKGFRSALKFVRTSGVDLAISCSPSARNALLVLRSGSRYKMGYMGTARSMTPFLEESRVEALGCRVQNPQWYSLENIYSRSLKIARALNLPVRNGNRMLMAPENAIQEADRILQELGIGEKPFVLIHPFSGWTFRSWDLSRFVWVAQELSKSDVHSVIVGTEDEELLLRPYLRELGQSTHLLVGKPLRNLIGLLTKARLFIGNDSGPLHLAALLGVPIVGLFGPATPELTAPPAGIGAFLYKRVECSPCGQLRCVRPLEPCVNLISREEVLASALSTLRPLERRGQ